MLRILFIYIILIFISCSTSTKHEQEERDITAPAVNEITGAGAASTNLPVSDTSVTVKVFSNEGDAQLKGFGYDIYIDGKRYVHQPHIPAVAGSRGFATEADARKTAEFAAYKIQHNIMPPSISAQELDSLGVK